MHKNIISNHKKSRRKKEREIISIFLRKVWNISINFNWKIEGPFIFFLIINKILFYLIHLFFKI